MSKSIRWDRKTLAAKAWFVAGRTLDFKCPRCSATGITMADQCRADLAERCAGFEALEKAHEEFAENYHALIDGVPNG